MKHFKKIIALVLSMLMIFSITGCGLTPSEVKEASNAEVIKIGVMSYNGTDSEMVMFRTYLKDYLGEIFNVEFYYSNSITNLEDEKAFIDSAKKIGCKGVIAFMAHDLEAIVDYCGEDMFFALQNMTPTEEEFNKVANKPQFLGVVSPSNESEYNAGAKIVKSLMHDSKDSSKTWLLFSAGASYGNNMHIQRFKGITDVLTASGYQLNCSAEDLLTAKAPMLMAKGKDGGEVYLCPGYPSVFKENVEQALSMCQADYIVSCCSLENNAEELKNYKKNSSKNIEIGLVDCFSEQVAEEISKGNISHISGKYAAMVVPSFIAMINAVSGHSDLVKNNGKAYWINQDMWSADSKEEFLTKYSDSISIYTNMYSATDLMKLVKIYNQDASYENFINNMTK